MPRYYLCVAVLRLRNQTYSRLRTGSISPRMEETLRGVRNPAPVVMVQLSVGCPSRFGTVRNGVRYMSIQSRCDRSKVVSCCVRSAQVIGKQMFSLMLLIQLLKLFTMKTIAHHFCLGVHSKDNPQDALQPQNTNGEHLPPTVLQIPYRCVLQ